MKYIADFHIHSRYSRATSKLLSPPYLDYWAKIKGIGLLATGDITHPRWTSKLKEMLLPADDGLFRLKPNAMLPDNPVPDSQVRFVLSGEISNIYKKAGKVRKVHNVVLAPSFETVDKIQKQLSVRGFNITSDGRPILGMDSRDLLEMLLEIDERIEFIPAHIWTPWFAALGSKSGFDSIEACYGDLTPYIHAVETGLSSDQPLNWLCSFLDKYSLLSNSDAHSPEKLGRNANMMQTELSYTAVRDALHHQDREGFAETIDLYPQEGKYHFDGHRKCGVVFNPTDTMQHGGLCPVCGKPLTLGVAHRIAELADRDDPTERPIQKTFHYIIPLKEIISELEGVGPNSKRVDSIYHRYIAGIGNEFDILLNQSEDSIRKVGGELLAEAVLRMRAGIVITKEGYDGEFGHVKLFETGELSRYGQGRSLFGFEKAQQQPAESSESLLNFDVKTFRQLKGRVRLSAKKVTHTRGRKNKAQEEAVLSQHRHSLVLAGPGTGKTHVLTRRIEYLLKKKDVQPSAIWAVTFTNQAAAEMRKRVAELVGKKKAQALRISTFHAFGLDFLKAQGDSGLLISEADKAAVMKIIGQKAAQIKGLLNRISVKKNSLKDFEDNAFNDLFHHYEAYKNTYGLWDTDDLIFLPLALLRNHPENPIGFNFQHILIDEFQDINPAQYELMNRFVSPQTHTFAIGDSNQSIYGFRGADNSLIQQYTQRFRPKTFFLEKSYRCPDTILQASGGVVRTKNALSGISEGLKIHISKHPTDKSEAENIARTVEGMAGGLSFFSMDSKIAEGNSADGIESLSDFAVLVRTKAQFDVLAKAFNDHALPYRLIGTETAFSEPPFDELTALLRLVQKPENEFLQARCKGFLPLPVKTDQIPDATKLIETLRKHYFAETLTHDNDTYQSYTKAAKGKPLGQFLTDIVLRSGQDDYAADIEAVQIMSLHASKGLEFEAVFIAGCEDGLLPYSMYQKAANVEEERRLLYVGMTRAKQYLFLSHAAARSIRNRPLHLPRSPFIDDIEKSLTEHSENKFKSKPKDTQLNLFDSLGG